MHQLHKCLDMISEAAGSGDSQLSGAASYDNEQTCRDLTQEAISRREISSVLLGNRFLGFWTQVPVTCPTERGS